VSGFTRKDISDAFPVTRFYNRVKSKIAKESDVTDFFVFYLTIEMGQPTATAQNIRDCYSACDLAAPSWLASYLSNGLKSRPRRFIRAGGGYRLEDKRREEITKLLGHGRPAVQTSAALNRLEAHVTAGPKREFLQETISCFEVGANRAAVVMCWNLALYHLQDYVIADPVRLASFNTALANNKDGRVKINVVTKPDDFTEMPESKFLLFCREAKIITSSIFKKLEGRLDERNSAAHPSGVRTTPKAAEAYIEDLVENVMVKFPA
jgi:hypothetical protein